MSTPAALPSPGGSWRLRPWPVLLTGLAITAVSLILHVAGDALAPIRFVLFLAGLITVGAALSMRFRVAGQDLQERLKTAGMLAVAAFAGLLAFIGADPSWDSMQMVLVALIAVTLLGIFLVLLPATIRAVVIGLLILIHFGGMITAATAIAPPGSSAPWVSRQLWSNFYRRYLEFMYLNNAYHFYSPEPGPPSLLWFHIKYDDGRVKWFKIPHRDEDAVPIHHTRLLSITESTAVTVGPPQNYALWSDLKTSREQAGEVLDIKVAPDLIRPESMQYEESQPFSQRLIESYVRHVAWEFPSLGDAGNKVKSIKVYRLRHNIISPQAVADGRGPLDKTNYVGFYTGEYDAEGKMLHPNDFDAQGKLVQVNDPFRYWYMPIYSRPKDNVPYRPDMKPDELELVDSLTRHARLDLDNLKVSGDPNDTPWDDAEEKHQP